MKSFEKAYLSGFLLTGIIQASALAAAGEVLTLENFQSQVRNENSAIRGAQATSEGASERGNEARLLTSPVLFGNWQLSSDSSLATSIIPRDKAITNALSVGVSQTTTFGLTARLSYSLNYTDMVGINPAFLPNPVFHDAKPALELTQSLWRNGFGSETRANIEASHAAAQAVSYAESFKTKLILAESENTYWRLVMARESVAIARENLERSNKLRDWSSRRSLLHLGDRSDLLQAEAALQARKLDLQNALDEERAASRAFNSARGLDANEVPEKLQSLDPRVVSALKAPEKARFREDVLAAEQQSRAAQATSRIGAEKNKPNFEVFGALALNGHDTTVGSAVTGSFTPDRPTMAVGARFTAPLDWSAMSANRGGYAKEEQGADLTYRRKVFEQEREWQDLQARLDESRVRFQLARKLEETQKEKLTVEKDRLSRGRTTTFQVLLFESDYALAQLGRIRAEGEILRIISQMRTFSGASS